MIDEYRLNVLIDSFGVVCFSEGKTSCKDSDYFFSKKCDKARSMLIDYFVEEFNSLCSGN